MRDGRDERFDWGNLRGRAEQRLRERKEAANPALREPERIVHELELHQVELEIQNEELREARLELESALARYTEIFDFAPIGYVTTTLDGIIREVNHAAAKLVGRMRSQLVGQRFCLLVPAPHAAAFTELVRLALVNEARESCELELLESPGKTIAVRLMATLLARAEPLLLLTVQELALAQPHESGVMPAVGRGSGRGDPGAAGQKA
jgi:PAS domain S-box-containing protein